MRATDDHVSTLSCLQLKPFYLQQPDLLTELGIMMLGRCLLTLAVDINSTGPGARHIPLRLYRFHGLLMTMLGIVGAANQ